MRVLIAGGGTGGHLFPGFAVARTLRSLDPAAEIHWVGGRRGMESRLVVAEGYPLTLLAAPSLRPAGAGPLAIARDAFALLRSLPQAISLLRRLRPSVVFATGGYIAIPVLFAAALTRTPSLLWEGNVVAGRSNRLVARFATARAVAWRETTADAPWSDPETHHTGTPVRDLAKVSRSAARRALGIGDGALLLLAFGGSQRALRLESALSGVLESTLMDWHVIHAVGDGIKAAEERRSSLPATLRDRYRPVEMLLGGAMEEALVAADLLLGRAGASTIAEAAAAGLPAVIVPYPYAGGHQRANATAFAAAGGGLLIDDVDCTPARLAEALEHFRSPALRSAAAVAARAIARPDAAESIATILFRIASPRSGAFGVSGQGSNGDPR